ncbi:phosphoribosylanthranilate isomerase [Thermomonas sp.]|uniref:phosphoribosylanthranilate isomerase n=1 Tax=Thermomonas sp. TaxID=1971895 RepID=UPI00262757AE|nr:phosphoribosylanthranilate isomerase [Thermomonas sp.]MCO5054805.1 phosphoribosylanthranilate isomerase [Thermomonas sp.]
MTSPPFRTRIKFCGLTRPGDARLAGELGVDAVGVIFAARSKRCVMPENAGALRQALPPLVDLVALFMDNGAGEIHAAIARARPTLLQFHGDEDDAFCRRFGLPYLKGVGMGGAAPDGQTLRRRWPNAAGFVLDGHAPGQAGGSGQRLDATSIPADLDMPWLLAGGLTPDNVGEAIRVVRPWGVDVAGGIESAPGIKDGVLMRRFVEAVQTADATAIG